MKLMIASDLHGSAAYCEKMIRRWEAEKADKLLLLGDLLYHGPRNDLPEGYAPKQVTAMLNGMKQDLLAVRGNCDAEIDQTVLAFPIMAEYLILPVNDRILYATHGHHFNKEHPLPMNHGDILLNGHFHIAECTDTGSFLYMNPGSAALPKDGHHSYMTLQDGRFLWKDIHDGSVFMEYTI